ncbi:Mitogen-activated protein kinase kinase kinase 5 [Linum perenne]
MAREDDDESPGLRLEDTVADDEEVGGRESPGGKNSKKKKKNQLQIVRRRFGASMDSMDSSTPLPNFDSLPAPTWNSVGNPIIAHRGRSFTQKRLTRQKKLRHLNDSELDKMLSERRSNSQPVSPESSPQKQSSLADGSGNSSWRYFPVPQPLPLPRRNLHRRLQSAGANWGHQLGHQTGSPGDGPFSSTRKVRYFSEQQIVSRGRLLSPPPSPDSIAKARTSPVQTDRRSLSPLPQRLPLPDSSLNRRPESPARHILGSDQLRSPDSGGKGTYSKPYIKSPSNCQESGGSTAVNSTPSSIPRSSSTSCFATLFPSRLPAAESSKSLSSRRKDLPKDLTICLSCKFGAVQSPQSTSSGSACSSQAVSPQRPSTPPGNLLQCPDEIHFRPDSEVPEFRLSGNNSPSSLVKHVQQCSPDVSPLHSPTLRSAFSNPRSPTKSKSARHQSKSGPLNQLNPYPLPLPPLVISPTQSRIPSPLLSPVTHTRVEKVPIVMRRNQWQKGKLIGRGTYGSVYVGTNRETGALCAIKEVDLIHDDPKSDECVRQLEQEIKVLRHLKHPNIVQYLGSETVDNHFNIYLEYVHPGSISKYVQEHCGAITESIVRNFTRHILSGLAFLHGTKTIHRDIKGANLLVDASGTVKLADFGMAKHLAGISYQLSLKGSPHWMAPEVIQAVMQKDGNPDLAFAVDIWSMGCTVIEMFTGKPPWGELQGPQAMFKVLNKSPPIPEALSTEGKDFLSCCFRRNPAERPTALQLLEHSFVRNSSDLNAAPAPSFTNLMDKPQISRESSNASRTDMLPNSQGTRTMIERLPNNSNETSHREYMETFSCGLASRELLSPTHVLQSSRDYFGSSNIASNISMNTMSSHPLTILRSHSREASYI